MRTTIAFASIAVLCAGTAFAYSSASYKREGLLAQWDAIDNAGTGVHDPDATVWKDIAPKGPGGISYDLAPSRSRCPSRSRGRARGPRRSTARESPDAPST